MPLATNKLRILGKKKDPVTGEFSPAEVPPTSVAAPVAEPKPEKKPS